MRLPGSNWAGNHDYSAREFVVAESETHVRELVLANSKVKPLGTRHCFNAIADTEGVLISTEYLNHIVGLHVEEATVTVQPGVRYGDLAVYLHERGFALRNLASLPHISVVGACATGTHGSGLRNRGLSADVAAIHFINGEGHPIRLKRGDDDFEGAVVHLGALGIVTELTLDVVPAFEVSQSVYLNLPLSELEERLEEIMGMAYSVSLFTDWRESAINQVWVKHKKGEEAHFLVGASPAAGPIHPIASMPPDYCTEQGGVPGPWHERLPHFRMEFTPSCGEELQSEFIVPIARGFEALAALEPLRSRIASLLLISEIRAVAADSLWLSPFFGRTSLAIHFTWKKELEAVHELLPDVEAALAPFEARPHWGKLFAMNSVSLRSLYPKWEDFRDLRQKHDPNRKFGNAYLDSALG